MSAGPTIDYDALAQEAMRGLVRTVLARTAKTGLPGDHHFYISFDTQAVGVVMSKRLKDKYPQEMTIVLQHRFWDLSVTDERFEVKLTFDGIPERLVIPFSALKVFFDPSCSYGLQFEETDMAARHPVDGEDSDRRPTAMTTRSSSPRKPRAPRTRARDQDGGERADGASKTAEPARTPSRPALAPVGANGLHGAGVANVASSDQKGEKGSEKGKEGAQPAAAEVAIEAANKPAPPPAAGAQIVSLDAFRKK